MTLDTFEFVAWKCVERVTWGCQIYKNKPVRIIEHKNIKEEYVIESRGFFFVL